MQGIWIHGQKCMGSYRTWQNKQLSQYKFGGGKQVARHYRRYLIGHNGERRIRTKNLYWPNVDSKYSNEWPPAAIQPLHRWWSESHTLWKMPGFSLMSAASSCDTISQVPLVTWWESGKPLLSAVPRWKVKAGQSGRPRDGATEARDITRVGGHLP